MSIFDSPVNTDAILRTEQAKAEAALAAEDEGGGD